MLHICSNCTTRYAESLQACPHCGSTDRRPAHEEDDMPKIVTGVGPSNALGQPRDEDQVPAGDQAAAEDAAGQDSAAAEPAQPKKTRTRAKKEPAAG